MSLTQEECEQLIAVPKHFKKPNQVCLPQRNNSQDYPLDGDDGNEFLLDYDRRGSIELKHKAQLREGKFRPIVRLEINGPEHINPDGELIGRNHLHVYREGYELRWAHEIEVPQTPLAIFSYFCDLCSIEAVSVQDVM